MWAQRSFLDVMCIINQFFSRTSLPDTFITPLLFCLVSYWRLWFSLGLYLERHRWSKRCQTHIPCQRAFELIYFCKTNRAELCVASLLKSSSDLFSQNKCKTTWDAAMSLNKSGSQVTPRCLPLEQDVKKAMQSTEASFFHPCWFIVESETLSKRPGLSLS